MKWLAQFLTWSSTVIVARLLTPSDYGIVAMATVFTGLVSLVSEFGIGTAVVNLRKLSETEIAQLNTIAFLVGILALAVGCAAAVPLSRLYRAPALVWVVVALSVGFVISGLGTVPNAVLKRELRFRLLALIDGGQATVMAGVMIVFAAMGFSYWTLVIGNLFSLTLTTLATICASPQRFAFPRLGALRSSLRFSRHVLVSRVSWYTYSNADFLIAGRVLGQAPLGAYTLAWSIANIPVKKVTALVTRVTPPFFSAVQDDEASLRRYLVNITQGLSIISWPAAIGLALVTEEFVTLMFGEEWQGAVVPLRILAIYTAFRSIVTVVPQVLNAIKDTRFKMWVGVASALSLPPAFYYASHWDTAGIAAVWLLVYPALTVPLYWRVMKMTKMSVGEYFVGLWPAFSGVVPMSLTVLGLKLVMAGQPLAWRFAAQVACGALVYVAVVSLLHRDRLTSFGRVLKDLRRKPELPSVDDPLMSSVRS